MPRNIVSMIVLAALLACGAWISSDKPAASAAPVVSAIQGYNAKLQAL